jgi:hypothetical protein
MKKQKTAWRLLAKALGEKASKNDKEADRVALIRLVMFLSIFITNCFIVANAIRHWNDEPQINLIIDGSYVIPSDEVMVPYDRINIQKTKKDVDI